MIKWIKNARIVSPGIELDNGAVAIENGRVKSVCAEVPENLDGEVIDAKQNYLMPGFIDVHCHGRNSFDFCDGDPEKTATILHNKLSEGVTSMLPTTLTVSQEDLEKSLNAVKIATETEKCRVKVPGVHLEGPFINPKCCGAQNPAFVREPNLDEVLKLNDIYPVKKITMACEVPGAVRVTEELLRRGIVPSCTHSAAKYAEFLQAYNVGLRNLSHLCNQMSGLHHRDIGLVGASLLHKDIFAELICDKLHISPPMIKLVFAIKGASQVVLITDAMRAAGTPDGMSSIGGLPVIVKNGEARLADSGALAGSTLQLCKAVKNVWEVTGLPLCEVVKSSAWSAAQSLGLAWYGKIEAGYFADFAMLDSNFDVVKTIVNGEVLYEK